MNKHEIEMAAEKALRRPDMPLKELFPALANHADEHVLAARMSTRSTNVLRYNRLLTWADLLDLSPGAIGRLRNAGQRTVKEIVRAAAHVAGTDRAVVHPRWVETRTVHVVRPAVEFALDAIASSAPHDPVVADADDAWLLDPPSMADLPPAELMIHLAESSNPGDWQMLWERYSLDGITSFPALGKRYGINRERVRQRIERADVLVRAAMQHHSDRTARVARVLGAAFPQDELRWALSAAERTLGEEVPPSYLWAALHHEGYSVNSGWVTRASLHRPDGPFLIDEEVSATCTALSIRARFHERLLSDVWGLRRYGDGWRATGASVADIAVHRLERLSRPATMTELGVADNQKDLIWSDDRIIRVSPDTYGLVRWGGKPFVSVIDTVIDLIRDNSGSMRVNNLVDLMVYRYGANETTIRTYVSGLPLLEQPKRGWVSLRQDMSTFQPTETTRTWRNAYALAEGIAVRFPLNGNALRGGGMVIPISVACFFDALPGNDVTFSSEFGDVTMRWSERTQRPHVDSLLAVLRSLDAQEGDHLIVTFGFDLRLSASLVRPSELEGLNQLERVARLCGVAGEEPLLDAVASALQMPAGERSMSALADWIRERGEAHELLA